MPATMFNLKDAEQWARDMGLSPDDLPTQLKCFDEEHGVYLGAKTPVERLDALADMLQVIACIKVCGGDVSVYFDQFEDCWMDSEFNSEKIRLALKEVVRSNNSKFVSTEEQGLREISRLSIEKKLFVGYRRVGVTKYKLISLKDQHDNTGKFVPKGKVLKPVTCFEPDLEQFL